jgi:P4 family phage/plasmid primase-like protien
MNAPMQSEAALHRLAEARKAFARGWLLTPLNGKRPKLKAWPTLPAPSAEEVDGWAARGNVGLRTGALSGVIVCDDDTPDGSGTAALDLPRTVTMITGSGKQHLYFKCPSGGIKNSVRKLAPGVDVRGEGGQVVFAGSIHPDTGKPYCWAPGLSPDEVPLAELPERILSLLRDRGPQPAAHVAVGDAESHLHGESKYVQAALARECAAVRDAAKGARNQTLNRAAFALGTLVGARRLDRVVAEAALLAAAAEHFGRDDFTADEARRTVASGLRAGEANPRVRVERDACGRPTESAAVEAVAEDAEPAPAAPLLESEPDELDHRTPEFLTDVGNGRRLAARFGADLRYSAEFKQWLYWDGRRWRPDLGDLKVTEMAKRTARRILRESERNGMDDGVKKAIIEHGRKSEKAERVRAMIHMARSEPGVPVAAAELDRDPYVFNVLNGTLDLRTGVLAPHRREDLLTKLAPVRFDSAAKAPRWESFVSQIMAGNASLVGFLRRHAGYALTALVQDHGIAIFHGEGSNGKSTYVRALQRVWGREYSRSAPAEMLMVRKNEAHSSERVILVGTRLVTCVEVDEGARLAEALLKQLTGDDRLSARRLYGEAFDFDPSHKIVACVNHRPVIRGSDHAIWRRIWLVPFDVTFKNPDRGLGAALAAEASGILNWALQGCREYLAEGLNPPPEVLAAMADYRSAMDQVGRFLEDRCDRLDGAFTTARALYDAYVAWCAESGETPFRTTGFGTRLGDHGLRATRTSVARGWAGVRLRGGDGVTRCDTVSRKSPNARAVEEVFGSASQRVTADDGGSEEGPA